MKSKIYVIALLLLSILIASCESDDLTYQDDFENSRNVWMDFKESSENSYKYVVSNSSWVGFAWETTITVSNGKVIQRHFKYTNTEGLSDDIPDEDLEWTEDENEIGSHKDVAEPLTLDEVYEKAKQEWLLKRKEAQTYFETKNNGLISMCGYVENGCQDDCFIGIIIKSVEVL
ncbi:hypothetical protein Q4Q39_04590 [Flavivirga amylovorans]|uniref:Lipoprotein n=1 Tax=Flavivirga amylovorans TaxID=870486 RepID=A0ABT8WZ73_9FLAO|nr:hypothetical protein [Flavivirga amylovorans]MDO5986679.1 hypothetical protein [Flavivirga amylovorans]